MDSGNSLKLKERSPFKSISRVLEITNSHAKTFLVDFTAIVWPFLSVIVLVLLENVISLFLLICVNISGFSLKRLSSQNAAN